MINKTAIAKYLEAIEEIKSTGIDTEMSYHPAFTDLIKSMLPSGAQVIPEAKKQSAGRPDFTILAKNGDTIGYIEAKKQGTDLKSVDTTPQIKRYREAFPNFIFTDFHSFRLYSNGKMVSDVCIDDAGLITDVSKTKTDDFSKLMNRFMSKTMSVETEVNIIAKLLAGITKDTLKPAIGTRLSKELSIESGEIYNAYTDFKINLLHDLTTDQFVDMYAQTITYGLLTAKMNHRDDATFDRKNALFDIPKGFGVLHAVFKFIATDDMPAEIEAAIDEIVLILIRTDPGRVLKRYFDDDQGKDWFIHFYETFLAEYNAKERKVRGVYYTPDSVVSYITRSVNDVLKTRFNKDMGFGDDDVRVLDPAVGTASFITSACQIGIDEMKASRGDGMIDGFIKNHILKRFYGFELMMTPYVLGHLKMKTLLDKNEYPMSNERVRLFLTNTLDTRGGEQSSLSDIGRALSDEAVCVSRVRSKKPILAVIGNPPYSGSSANRGLFDKEMILYKDHVRNESISYLSDDYIKFIRFAHKRVDDQGEGVIGYITNNSYLSGIVHRGMRKELMRSFDEIYIFNLHGNAMTDEKGDKNVFDIKQGVSIAIFVKTTKNTDDAKIYYSDLIGSRESKYDYLDGNDINTTEWIELDAVKPYHFFEPKDFSAQNDYDKFIPISHILNNQSPCIITSRDKLTIQYTKESVWNIIKDFANIGIEDARNKYDLPPDNTSWKVSNAQKDVIESVLDNKFIKKILYRPFDNRYTYYTGHNKGIMSCPNNKMMQHMTHDNIGMLLCRQQSKLGFHHVFISGDIVDSSTVSNRTKEIDHVYPLYLYTNNTRTPNIPPNIITTLTTTYDTKPTPEDLFYYIYGILHSNTYRQKYAELLKIDFPKIPFTTNHDMFMRIGSIGKQLADIHLMKPDVFNHSTIKYCGRGAHKVEKITYDESAQRVYINKAQYFDGISADVWEYQIGGYKPMQKWLKDRRHDTLTADDVDHYRYIGAALERTMILQTDIDDVYGEIDAGEIVEFAPDNAQTTL